MTCTTAVLLLAFSTATQAGALFDPPEGLTPTDVPDISGTPIGAVEKYSDAGGLVQVTVFRYSPITFLKKANEFAAGVQSGMKRKGLQGGQVTDVQVKGFSCKRIEGKFAFEGYEGAYAATTLAIFTSEFVYTIALSVHDSASFDLSVEDLVDRMSLRGEPAQLNTGAPPPSSAFQGGQKIGEIMAFVIVVLAVVLVVRRLNRKKAEQTTEAD